MINKSKTYVLPLFMNHIKLEYINKIYNTYVFLEDNDEDLIVISYKKDIKTDFNYEDYISYLKNSKLFIELINYDDKINIVLKIPEDELYDYNKFLNGKYSMMSEKSKNLILNTIDLYCMSKSLTLSSKNRVKDVLYLRDDLRAELEIEFDMKIPNNWELSSIINTEDETFKMVYEE